VSVVPFRHDESTPSGAVMKKLAELRAKIANVEDPTEDDWAEMDQLTEELKRRIEVALGVDLSEDSE